MPSWSRVNAILLGEFSEELMELGKNFSRADTRKRALVFAKPSGANEEIVLNVKSDPKEEKRDVQAQSSTTRKRIPEIEPGVVKKMREAYLNQCAHHQCSAHRQPRKSSSLHPSSRRDQHKNRHRSRETPSPASSLHDEDLFRADCSEYNVATLPTRCTGTKKDRATNCTPASSLHDADLFRADCSEYNVATLPARCTSTKKDRATNRTPETTVYSQQCPSRQGYQSIKPAVSRQTQTEYGMGHCPRCQEGGKITPSAGLAWKNREKLFDEPSSSDLSTSDALNALSLYQTTSGSVVSAVTTKSRNAKIFADSSALQGYGANMGSIAGAKVLLGRRKHQIQEEVVQLNPISNRNVVIGHKANCNEEKCKRCQCCPYTAAVEDRRYLRTVTPVSQSRSDENFSTARQDSSPGRTIGWDAFNQLRNARTKWKQQGSKNRPTSGWDTFSQLKNASTKWKQVAKSYLPRTNSEFWRGLKDDLPESSMKPGSRAAWPTPQYQEDASDRMFGMGRLEDRDDIPQRWRDAGARVNRTMPTRRQKEYREPSEPYRVPNEEARRQWRKMGGRANALSRPLASDRYAGEVSEEGYGPFENIKQKWQQLGTKAKNMMMPRREEYPDDDIPRSRQQWRDAGRRARDMTRIGRWYGEDAADDGYHPNQDARNKWQNFGARANNMMFPDPQRGYLDDEAQINTRSHWQKAGTKTTLIHPKQRDEYPDAADTNVRRKWQHAGAKANNLTMPHRGHEYPDEIIETDSPTMREKWHDFGEKVNRTMWPGRDGGRDTPPDAGMSANANRDMWEGRERDRATGSDRSATPDFDVRQKWRDFSTRVGRAVWPERPAGATQSPDSDARQRWRKIGARAYKFMPGSRRQDGGPQDDGVGPGQYVRDKWRDFGAKINKMAAPGWGRDSNGTGNEPINDTIRRKFKNFGNKVNRMMTPSRGPQSSSEDDSYNEHDSFVAPMPSGWSRRQGRYPNAYRQERRHRKATCTKKVLSRSTEAFYRPEYLRMNEWDVDTLTNLPRNSSYNLPDRGYNYIVCSSGYDGD